MKIDLDSYREILDALTRNKSRSLLTGFGVFWGVFMLVALIGGGQGLKGMLQKNFDGFATNSAMIWAQPTTMNYKGFGKGRQWAMETKDVARLRRAVPELDVVTPIVFAWSGSTVVRGDLKSAGRARGVYPDYRKVCDPLMRYGRFINPMDIEQTRKVCVIGKRIYKDLFPEGGDPCGKRIRVDNVYYEVVGVDYREGGGMNIGGSADEAVSIPITLVQQAYNRGQTVDIIAVTGRKGVTMSTLSDRMRHTIAHAHAVHPADDQSVMVFNTEVMFKLMDNLFAGVNFLIWLVGIGTLLAGAVGVSNIMMVTVRERTAEIGIRRAIGATPKMILAQILSESVTLTAVAGMSGIMLAVAVLQMLEMANTDDGMLLVRFQVDFSTAVSAALLLCVLGGMAGIAPALRAMGINPVDAMRDE